MEIDGRDIDSLRVVDLKQELEKRGLPKSGTKKDLLARLKKWLHQQSEAGVEEAAPEAPVTSPKSLPNVTIADGLQQNDFVQEYLALREQEFNNATVEEEEPTKEDPEPVVNQLQPEPVAKIPEPKPVTKTPEPVAKQTEPEPVTDHPGAKQSDPEPVIKQPDPEPLLKKSEPKPVIEQPEPVVKKPEPEPEVKKNEPEPVVKKPEPEPVVKQPEPQPMSKPAEPDSPASAIEKTEREPEAKNREPEPIVKQVAPGPDPGNLSDKKTTAPISEKELNAASPSKSSENKQARSRDLAPSRVEEEEEEDGIDIKAHEDEFKSFEKDDEDSSSAAIPKEDPPKAEKETKADPVKEEEEFDFSQEKTEELVPIRKLKTQQKTTKRVWGSRTKVAPAGDDSTADITSELLKDVVPDIKPLLTEELKPLDAVEEEEEDAVRLGINSDDEMDQDQEVQKSPDESTEGPAAKRQKLLVEAPTTAASRTKTESFSENGKGKDSASSNADLGSPSPIVFLRNLVRPFTSKQLNELLSRTGKITEEGIWMDKIKSKCLVTYTDSESAEETCQALNGVKWPSSNPKTLMVRMIQEKDREAIMAGESKFEDKNPNSGLNRNREREREREKDDDRRKRRKISESKKEEVPAKRMSKPLEELFNKTKALPSIYWKPKHEIPSKN